MSHKSEIEAIWKLIDSLGGTCLVFCQSRRLFGSAGIPDLYCLIPSDYGRRIFKSFIFWCEVKVGDDKLSEAQAEVKRRIEQCGGLAIVGGKAEVIAYLKREGVPII